MTVACDESHLCVEVWGVPGLPYGRRRQGPGHRSVSWAGSAGASPGVTALGKHWGEGLCTVKQTHCAQTPGPGMCTCYQPDNSDTQPPAGGTERGENFKSGSLEQVENKKERVA